MKVLYICSGNKKAGLSPVVQEQARSVEKEGIHIDYYLIRGRGIQGYLKAVFELKKHLNKHAYNLFHAHYSLSAIVASLAGARPLVVSLMGSDIHANLISLLIVRSFKILFQWKVIVKSEEMYNRFGLKDITIIPNGVDMLRFRPLDRKECLDKIQWDKSRIHILFAADSDRNEKNFEFAEKGVSLITEFRVDLHAVYSVPHINMVYYFNAATLILITSKWEGSPNVIKEAMACNRPVVSTDVGDVKWLIGEEAGHYISSTKLPDLVENIKSAIDFADKYQETNGRERIFKLGLDSVSIARGIIHIYKQVVDNACNN